MRRGKKTKKPKKKTMKKMKKKEKKEETHRIKRTSRPKARDGHRYPCPAFVFPNGCSLVSRAAAPEGTGGDKVL